MTMCPDVVTWALLMVVNEQVALELLIEALLLLMVVDELTILLLSHPILLITFDGTVSSNGLERCETTSPQPLVPFVAYMDEQLLLLLLVLTLLLTLNVLLLLLARCCNNGL